MVSFSKDWKVAQFWIMGSHCWRGVRGMAIRFKFLILKRINTYRRECIEYYCKDLEFQAITACSSWVKLLSLQSGEEV